MTKSTKLDNITNISAYDYYKFYGRITRFFGVLWILLTLSFTIIIIVVFLSPNWVGDTRHSTNRGYFGLYSFCTRNRLANEYTCFGTWTDLSSFPSDTSAIKAACVLVSLTCLLSLVSLVIILFCILVKCERIFHISAWIQGLCTIFLVLALTIYPIGWDTNIIRSVCGSQADQFIIGTCAIRWPYILACIATLLVFLLSIFGFLLASRQAKFILRHGSECSRHDNFEASISNRSHQRNVINAF